MLHVVMLEDTPEEAATLRGHLERYAAEENLELFEKMGAGNMTPEQTLKEFVGHTPLQVAAGAILGFVVAVLFNI